MKKITLFIFLTFIVFHAKSKDFNFALITDIHMTKDTAAYNDLVRSVDEINSNNNLSFVLVTGDLSESGDRASLLRVKSLLDQLKVKYYVVSGNHETKWSESGATDFSSIFGSERFKFEYDNVLFLGFATGPIIRMMDGHVASQDVRWLQQELANAKKQQQVILVTHYPLTANDVDNWYEVTDIARKYNVKAVLGGHYHRNVLLDYDGIPGIVNRSNLKGKENVGGYSIYKINSDSILVYEKIIGKQAQKWGGYSLSTKYYSKDNSKYDRPDYSVNAEFPEVETKWINQIGSSIYSSPVVYQNMIFVGDDTGYLHALRRVDGVPLWSFKSQNRIIGTPAVRGNVVVFGSADTYIYGVNVVSGLLQWKYKTDQAVLGSITIQDSTAYVGCGDNSFRALNIKTGDLKWSFSDLKGYVETKPLIEGNKVIFGAWDGHLYALDKENGRLLWKWNNGTERMHFSPAAVWPVAAEGKVFVTAPDRVMTAIDIETGKTIWRTKESVVRETIALSVDKERIYSKTMQDSVVCYSTKGDVPQRLWAVNVGYGYDHAPSMPVEKDGMLFGSTKNGIIFSLDVLTGELMWKHKVGNSLINTLVPLSMRRCVFTSSDGTVGVLKINNSRDADVSKHIR